MSSDVPISIEAQIQAVNIAAANATADAREDERNFAAHAAALRAAAETLRKVQAGELVHTKLAHKFIGGYEIGDPCQVCGKVFAEHNR